MGKVIDLSKTWLINVESLSEEELNKIYDFLIDDLGMTRELGVKTRIFNIKALGGLYSNLRSNRYGYYCIDINITQKYEQYFDGKHFLESIKYLSIDEKKAYDQRILIKER